MIKFHLISKSTAEEELGFRIFDLRGTTVLFSMDCNEIVRSDRYIRII